jgi:hypothetical protein
MRAYECGLKTRDSAMINVTGGNAWLMDASISLSLSLFLCLFPSITELVMVLTNHKSVQTRSPAGKQHNGGGGG